MRWFILILFTLIFHIAQSKSVEVVFSAYYNGKPLQLDVLQADSVTIQQLIFYVSEVKVYNKGELVVEESESFHLVDFNTSGSATFRLEMPNNVPWDEIHFAIGVDSAYSTVGALGGALDPTNGLYWTWNSGYINFKLEGTHPALKTHNHLFDYHLGGFMQPYPTLQRFVFPVKPAETITVGFDCFTFLQSVDMLHNMSVTVPGKLAFQAANCLKKAFFSSNEK